MYIFYASICSGIPGAGLDVFKRGMFLKESALAKFLQSLLMKLMPLSKRNFSVQPKAKNTLQMYSCTRVFLQMSFTGITNT